ncbi:YdeI/OmpD-associated family protein [Adhaeribacter pallidiroseus]|uniref:Bacteriocin-protection protein, YdeI/OmpD-associated family n=1 Tax=Adhaeribacter pallidiroseus TaxID=2072847 RepID=A0A369QDC4_9BACT|nr:YdeI/OmpD-associated family protein [Adhaeribacter pallidiroseus]RDC62422.1 hypothetical protein AHMF7616_01016 [Adhaeribacter pallidiroseus]
MQKKDIATFCPASQKDWRQWLVDNHQSKQAVGLIFYKKKSGMPTISWSHAVDEALCFGWIDSKKIALDQDKFMQFFTQRKPNGTWSKVNKEKIKHLIGKGLMTPAGFASIDRAKQNGSWTILDEVEKLIIPLDLAKEFETKKGSQDFFLRLSKSVRKALLQRLAVAKLPVTRQKRMAEIADLVSQKLETEKLDKPSQLKRK